MLGCIICKFISRECLVVQEQHKIVRYTQDKGLKNTCRVERSTYLGS